MKRALLFCLGLWSGVAAADERISVCYNYGCAAEEVVRYSEAQLASIRKTLVMARTPEQERAALGPAIGRLYFWAGQQSPIHADKGGNTQDDAVPGSMDCIDHSTTTTRLLQMMKRRGMLRFHEVEDVERRTRGLIFDHYSAVIEELPPRWLLREKIRYTKEEPEETKPEVRPQRFAVDSWFLDNGKPAVILPLEEWKDGAGPGVDG